MSLYSEIISGGGLVSVVLQLTEGNAGASLYDYIQGRWPGLAADEIYSLMREADAAKLAGAVITGGDLGLAPKLGELPTVPELAGVGGGGFRTQYTFQLVELDDSGNVVHTYLVVIQSDGLETLQDLVDKSIDNLKDRARKSPGSFTFDPDASPKFIWSILAAAKAF